jgi:hypothetical protein
MMNTAQFDRLMQRLTRAGSRRQMLGGIVGAAAVLATAGALEASKGKGKSKAKGKGKEKSKGHGSAGAPGKQPRVGVCHFDDASGLFTYLELPPPAANAHTKHGDQSLTEADCLAQNPSPSAPAEA